MLGLLVNDVEKDLEVNGLGLIQELDQDLHGGTKENRVKLKSRWSVSSRDSNRIPTCTSLERYRYTILLRFASCDSSLKCVCVCVCIQVSQEERSIVQEVIISVILSKKLYMYKRPIPNGFRDRAISLHSTVP
jgi:hypothetical protein